SQVVGRHHGIGRRDLLSLGEGMDGVAGGGEEAAAQDVDVVLVDELARLGERRLRVALGVLDDELDLSAGHGAVDLVEVQLGTVEHVLAERRGGAGQRRQEADLDRAALRPRGRRAEPGDESEEKRGETKERDGATTHEDLLWKAPARPRGAKRMTPM